MQRFLWLSLLALPLIAPTAHAQYFNPISVPPVKMDGGLVLNFNLFAGGGRTQLGPWYLYWPYDAHFNMPPPLGAAMPGSNFMTLPPQMLGGQQAAMPQQQQWTPPAPAPIPPNQQPPATPAPQQQPPRPQQTMFQPVGYYFASPVPGYWYGN